MRLICWTSAFLFCLAASRAIGQNCFGINTLTSSVLDNTGEMLNLPSAGGKLPLPCTRTIRNLYFSIDFALGTERYFEDSTQFNAVLNYKSSTFILQYNKGQNTFYIGSDQALGDGIYTLTLSSIMCAPSGSVCNNCFIQYSFTVEYVNDPDWSISVESEPDPPVLTCFAGSQVILKGTPPPHSGFQVQWARLVGTQFVNIPGAVTPQYTAAQSGTYLYTVVGPANCRASNLISVKPPERPEIQLSEPQQKLNSCAQAIAGVSIADSSAPGNLSLSWAATLGGVILSGANTLAPVVGTPGVYTLIVARADNGCADTATVSVIAGDIPIVQVAITSVSGTDVLDCKTPSLLLKADASVSTGPGVFSFLWSDGSQTATLEVSQPGIYALTITDLESGCVGYGDKAIFQNTQPPMATLSSNRDTVCAGESVVLSATSPDPVSFQWPDGSSGLLFTATPQTDGPNTYAVTVTSASNGCSAVFEKVITRIAYPVLTCLPEEITLYHGQTGTLNCTTNATAQLHWSASSFNVANIPAFGTGPVQGRLFELSSLRAPGRVVFTVFARSGVCASPSAQVTVHVLPPDNTAGIYIPEVITPDGDGQNDTWDIMLPPDAASPETYKLVVYNRHGAVVWQGSLVNPFTPSQFPDGVYFYLLTTPEGADLRGAVSIWRKK